MLLLRKNRFVKSFFQNIPIHFLSSIQSETISSNPYLASIKKFEESFKYKSEHDALEKFKVILKAPTKNEDFLLSIIQFFELEMTSNSNDIPKVKKIQKVFNEIKSSNNLDQLCFCQTVENFDSLLNLMNLCDIDQQFSSKIILINFSHLIKEKKITQTNFIETLEKLLLPLKKSEKLSSVDSWCKTVLTEFFDQFLKKNKKSRNLVAMAEFASYLPSDFSIHWKLAENLSTKCFDYLFAEGENGLEIKRFSKLFPYLLNYYDTHQDSVDELAQILSFKAENIVIDHSLINLILNTYQKVSKNRIKLLEQLFPIYNSLLDGDTKKQTFNLNLLEIQEIKPLGDFIKDANLTAGSLINLLRSCLKSDITDKVEIKFMKTDYIYELNVTFLDESLNIDDSHKSYTNPQQIKEIISNFFSKMHIHFNFKGLLLILYLNSNHFISLGKLNSLLFTSLRRESLTLTDEEFIQTLHFLRETIGDKKYLPMLTSFDKVWKRILDNMGAKDSLPIQNLVKLLTGDRNDLVFTDFRTIDCLLDNALTKQIKYMKLPEIKVTMASLLRSRMECNNFYSVAKEKFENDYKTTHLGVAIDLLQKFVFLGMPINNEVLKEIIRKYAEVTPENKMFNEAAISLKLLSTILLLNRFEQYDESLYRKILNSFKNYKPSEFKKE